MAMVIHVVVCRANDVFQLPMDEIGGGINPPVFHDPGLVCAAAVMPGEKVKGIVKNPNMWVGHPNIGDDWVLSQKIEAKT